jgi:hypothetical protein
VEPFLLLLIFLMTFFLFVFVLYLLYLLVKFNRIKQEEMKKISKVEKPTVRREGESLLKIPTPKYRLEMGGSYFLFDKGSQEGYRLVKAYLARGYRAVTITYFDPNRLKKRLDPFGSDFIWLTRKKVDDTEEAIVAPTNLGFIIQELEDRLEGDKEIVFFDGLDRCYKDNGMDRTDKFLKNLKKLIEKRDAVLHLSIEAAGTNRKTRDFLKKTFKQLGTKKKG